MLNFTDMKGTCVLIFPAAQFRFVTFITRKSYWWLHTKVHHRYRM